MHMNEIFYALICINNHVLSCLISILSYSLTPNELVTQILDWIKFLLDEVIDMLINFIKNIDQCVFFLYND